MCCRFYIDKESSEMQKIIAQMNRSQKVLNEHPTAKRTGVRALWDVSVRRKWVTLSSHHHVPLSQYLFSRKTQRRNTYSFEKRDTALVFTKHAFWALLPLCFSQTCLPATL